MLLLTFQYLTEAKGGQQKIWLVFGSHWLVDWLVGWLVGWMVGWYSHWLVQLLGVELENNRKQGHKCCTLSR